MGSFKELVTETSGGGLNSSFKSFMITIKVFLVFTNIFVINLFTYSIHFKLSFPVSGIGFIFLPKFIFLSSNFPLNFILLSLVFDFFFPLLLFRTRFILMLHVLFLCCLTSKGVRRHGMACPPPNYTTWMKANETEIGTTGREYKA